MMETSFLIYLISRKKFIYKDTFVKYRYNSNIDNVDSNDGNKQS